MACSLFDDEATQRQLFLDCIDAIIDEQLVSQRLTAVYIDVLAHTTEARIVASRYYLAIPAITLFDEWQGQAMVDGVNAQVESAVAAVKESGAQYAARIAVSDPPRFDSGWPGTGQDADLRRHACRPTGPATRRTSPRRCSSPAPDRWGSASPTSRGRSTPTRASTPIARATARWPTPPSPSSGPTAGRCPPAEATRGRGRAAGSGVERVRRHTA